MTRGLAGMGTKTPADGVLLALARWYSYYVHGYAVVCLETECGAYCMDFVHRGQGNTPDEAFASVLNTQVAVWLGLNCTV